LARLKSVRL